MAVTGTLKAGVGCLYACGGQEGGDVDGDDDGETSGEISEEVISSDDVIGSLVKGISSSVELTGDSEYVTDVVKAGATERRKNFSRMNSSQGCSRLLMAVLMIALLFGASNTVCSSFRSSSEKLAMNREHFLKK